ncbi:MAG: preprotein translocase subunit SecE [Phycisphaerales bacterium]
MADKDIKVRTVEERSPGSVSERSPSPNGSGNGSVGSSGLPDHGWGLFKPGRGYWVRVLTAVALGLLFLTTALWAAKSLEAFNPPVRAWSVRVTSLKGELPTPGQKLELSALKENKPVVIGSAVVEGVTKDSESAARVTVRDVMLGSKEDSPTDTKRVSVAGATPDAPAVFSGQVTSNPTPEYKFDRIYLQAGVGGAILLVGVLAVYRFVGNKPATVDFLIATDEEMRKVHWSSRKIILDSTLVVVTATFFIAALIFVADLVLKQVLLNQFVGR